MRVLVVYDVNTESKEGRRRLRKVAKACEGFGQRVQKSVFECALEPTHYESLRHKLTGLIDEKEDDLRLYRLPEDAFDAVEHFGTNVSIDYQGPLVI